MAIWAITTPGGHVVARTEGTKAAATKWAKAHYSVFKVKEDKAFAKLWKILKPRK
jgi:hypothetical protein